MIYLPLHRTLKFSQDIRDSDITDEEKKRLNSAMALGRIHIRRQIQPPLKLAIAVLQPWKSNLPFGIDIPILPYV